MIRYEIPKFLVRHAVADYVNASPSISATEARSEWMTSKYFAWIEDHIGTPFGFDTNPNDMYFDVTFDNSEHADAFLAQMGGKVH